MNIKRNKNRVTISLLLGLLILTILIYASNGADVADSVFNSRNDTLSEEGSYISEISVLTGASDEAIIQKEAEGYHFIKTNISKSTDNNSGGLPTYLCYKRTAEYENAITELKIYIGKKEESKISEKRNMVIGTKLISFLCIDYNFNEATDDAPIYLYYSKSEFAGKPITELLFTEMITEDTKCMYNGVGGFSGEQNVNLKSDKDDSEGLYLLKEQRTEYSIRIDYKNEPADRVYIAFVGEYSITPYYCINEYNISGSEAILEGNYINDILGVLLYCEDNDEISWKPEKITVNDKEIPVLINTPMTENVIYVIPEPTSLISYGNEMKNLSDMKAITIGLKTGTSETASSKGKILVELMGSEGKSEMSVISDSGEVKAGESYISCPLIIRDIGIPLTVSVTHDGVETEDEDWELEYLDVMIDDVTYRYAANTIFLQSQDQNFGIYYNGVLNYYKKPFFRWNNVLMYVLMLICILILAAVYAVITHRHKNNTKN